MPVKCMLYGQSFTSSELEYREPYIVGILQRLFSYDKLTIYAMELKQKFRLSLWRNFSNFKSCCTDTPIK